MCKIMEYWFSCQHGFQLRISQCGGTKHRKVRGGLTAACKSESYLNIVFSIDCGPCQHETFEKGWNRKLEWAKTFRGKLREKEMPGMQEVAALVEQLEDDFNTASWNTRAVFPHFHKERSVRASLGHFRKAPSPLRQEVLPSDIREPPEVIDPNHPDHEYDWDYIASTDPLHPVDVNYTHPLEEVDPCWMLNHLSPEEFEQAGGEVGFDANESPDQSSRSPDTPAPNSTRTLYDKWRRHISKTRDTDRVKFNKNLLLLSRCEIEDVEGLNGCFVQDPQIPQDVDAKNG
ncbi:hypothetical protein BU25DRAFT_347286 [Macroventuria anomochaeta]|uniref:Uncharacterized protein n=1 Tax=Macroventuria anomochaeta TaxID=301207 RepID=A0ACB6RS40_9PLEO|nr:uncharacterized protein BU25DRAFT_347286 [Macroventuria anomochaeta]KAF2624721.1 hypothetical protein BU25DRAFT_347286 [Macroventuria anomochaeta]